GIDAEGNERTLKPNLRLAAEAVSQVIRVRAREGPNEIEHGPRSADQRVVRLERSDDQVAQEGGGRAVAKGVGDARYREVTRRADLPRPGISGRGRVRDVQDGRRRVGEKLGVKSTFLDHAKPTSARDGCGVGLPEGPERLGALLRPDQGDELA